MKRTRTSFLCLCLLFTTSFGSGTTIEDKNTSTEVISNHHQNQKQIKSEKSKEKDCVIDNKNLNETVNSLKAMSTREDLKTSARKTRSSEVDKKAFRNMLLGLVHKKTQDTKDRKEQQKFQSDASELLLELMVRIAAHPQQWDEVHDLLQTIDTDILTSKKILTEIQNTATSGPASTQPSRTEATTEDEVQKLIILLDNDNNQYPKNVSQNWPNFDDSTPNTEDNTKEKPTTQNIYHWKKNNTKEFEFAYHRVTGLPLPYRSNYDKTRARNAYIAVSVIAPKSRDVEKQDNLLEDELRQLKPWSHEENLSKMENIRKKWFIRQDADDEKSETP